MEYVSDYVFSKIMDDGEFNLPIEWDGDDFLSTISNLFDKYLKKINAYCPKKNYSFY